MKNSTKVILAIVIILVLLNNVNINIGSKELSIDKYRSEGYVSYIVNSEIIPNEENDKDNCPCKGTKQITHGDGHKTPCPCDNCKCSKSLGQEEIQNEEQKDKEESANENESVKKKLKRQLIMLTSKKEKMCIKFSEEELSKLEKSGWSVGYLSQDNLCIIDINLEPATARTWMSLTGVEKLPQFIKLVDGKYVGHKAGFHNAIELAEWHNE